MNNSLDSLVGLLLLLVSQDYQTATTTTTSPTRLPDVGTYKIFHIVKMTVFQRES